jgi:X-Pro dipeptidyl-peptidase
MKKIIILFFIFVTCSHLWASTQASEVVFVESPNDTDNDGKLDLIYVSIDRPSTDLKISSIFTISPYSLGGNMNAANHGVDSDYLPQDEIFSPSFGKKDFKTNNSNFFLNQEKMVAPKYAQIHAHSLGTGRSKGCPSVGDKTETLAAKSVIDWLNGRARGFTESGLEVKADWSNGKAGMIGTSYDGTLPIMVAATGVDGLKAIVPIAAISNWYDYYRSNGLVVNPGGYIGEDADVLGYFIVRRAACKNQLKKITQSMGREHGDFHQFWQDRDHLSQVKNIKAATFIIHGQSDWNVKQKHAIQLWETLPPGVPRRMFLHRGGHGSTSQFGVPKKIQAWFNHFLQGEENDITKGPQVEVELPDGLLVTQEDWPHEDSRSQRFYLSDKSLLTLSAPKEIKLLITDIGQSKKVERLLESPQDLKEGRLVFLTTPFQQDYLLTGTPFVSLNLSVLNRKAANLTVVLVEYDKNGRGQIITRGWADPQNYRDPSQGELLIPGQDYQLGFPLEPKQYRISTGGRLGVLLTSTDYDFTLRPKPGTQIQFNLGKDSFINLDLTPWMKKN